MNHMHIKLLYVMQQKTHNKLNIHSGKYLFDISDLPHNVTALAPLLVG